MSANLDQELRNADWTKQTRDVDLKPDEERPFDKAQKESERKVRMNRYPARRDGLQAE